MKYVIKANIKVRKEPSLNSERKFFAALTDTLKKKCYEEEGWAVVRNREIINVLDTVEDNEKIFGKIGKNAYILLQNGDTKLAVLYRKNTNTERD